MDWIRTTKFTLFNPRTNPMKIQKSLTSLLTIPCLVALVGCQQETASTATAPAVATDDHGHERGGGEERDHGVVGHGHGVGPHEGVIADWGGGKFHVEFTVDHDKTQACVYVLGGDEKTPIPIDAPSIELYILDPK